MACEPLRSLVLTSLHMWKLVNSNDRIKISHVYLLLNLAVLKLQQNIYMLMTQTISQLGFCGSYMGIGTVE